MYILILKFGQNGIQIKIDVSLTKCNEKYAMRIAIITTNVSLPIVGGLLLSLLQFLSGSFHLPSWGVYNTNDIYIY